MAMTAIHKVMLVEDDAGMQSVLCTLLQLEGFAVISAPASKSQEEIVNHIRDAKPDVILLDVYLGEINGIDVLRQLRAEEAIHGTRVVMTSGMDVMDQCMDIGADSFLLKPFMPDELIRKLRG